MTGAQLYTLTGQLLLGYQMDRTLFYQLLNSSKGEREQMRPWMILRTEDATQVANPVQNTITNSMYLTPFDLPSDFLKYYSPTRAIVLVASDGITFRWYKQIPIERKHEYKDDDTRFYIDVPNNNLFLCGILDRQYTIHQFYVASSPDITDSTSWVFPSQFHPILAYDVALKYRSMFKWDALNVSAADRIAANAGVTFKQMTEWDAELAEDAIEGADYPMDFEREGFRNKTVGDSNYSLS